MSIFITLIAALIVFSAVIAIHEFGHFAVAKLCGIQVNEFSIGCLAACKKAIRKGGLGPCAANGANEEAVRLFLEDKIGFLDIGRLVEAVVDSDSFGGDYTLSDVYECDRMAREFVRVHL